MRQKQEMKVSNHASYRLIKHTQFLLQRSCLKKMSGLFKNSSIADGSIHPQ